MAAPDVFTDGHAADLSSEDVPPLPSATPLSHSHPSLSAPSGSFSPSSLLLSLLPSSLSSLATQLSSYDETLTSELQSVVDAEYRDFIALSDRLGGERHRIERLAHWASSGGGDAGGEGLEGARVQVEREREEVLRAQRSVEELLRSRGQAEERRAALGLMLSIADAVERLERLLLIEEGSAEGGGGHVDGGAGEHATHADLDWDDEDADIEALGRDSGGDDSYDSDSESTPLSSSDEDDEQPLRSKPPAPAPRRPSHLLQNGTKATPIARARLAHTLDLPTRISRAKTSWEALTFMRRSAMAVRDPTEGEGEGEGRDGGDDADSPLMPFLAAHDARIAAVEAALKSDLRALLARLLIPGSLLVEPVRGNPTHDEDEDRLRDLDRASQVPADLSPHETRQAKLAERRTWLSMVLSTWLSLGSRTANSSAVQEIRDFVTERAVRSWVGRVLSGQPVEEGANEDAREDDEFLRGIMLSGANGDADADGKSNATSASSLSLARIYNNVLRHAYSLRGILAAIEDFDLHFHAASSSSAPHPPSQLQPFTQILTAPILSALTQTLGSTLFYVGTTPAHFHANFNTTQRFLAALEELAPSRRVGLTFRRGEELEAFMRRWQVGVFFQMRYRSIASALESEIAAAASSSGTRRNANVNATALPLLPASAAALHAFTAPWHPQGHLAPLVPRQWRLSLMVVARYFLFLSERAEPHLGVAGGAGGRTTSASASAAATASGATSRVATPDAEKRDQKGEGDDAALHALSTLAADGLWFGAEVQRAFEGAVLPLLPGYEEARSGQGKEEFEDVVGEMRGAYAQAFRRYMGMMILRIVCTDLAPIMLPLLSGLCIPPAALQDTFPLSSTLLPRISLALTSILKARCGEPLRLVRSVNTQYRAGSAGAGSSRPGPGTSLPEPSYFVPQILRSLRAFLGKAQAPASSGQSGQGQGQGEGGTGTPAGLVPREVKTQWAADVVEDVVERYASSLTQMIQNYESLRRLKRGNAPSSSSSSSGGLGGLASSLWGRGSGGSGSATPPQKSDAAAPGGDDADPEWARMRAQMQADVLRLERDVRDLSEVGVELRAYLAESAAWKKVRGVVELGE